MILFEIESPTCTRSAFCLSGLADLAGAWPTRGDLAGDLEILRRCDALWAIEGWNTSEGTCNEIKQAQGLGEPVLHERYEVLVFLGR